MSGRLNCRLPETYSIKYRRMILHDKLKFAQLVKIFISFTTGQDIYILHEKQRFIPCSQKPAPKLEYSSRWASTKPILILSSHLHLRLFSDFVPSQVFRPKYVSSKLRLSSAIPSCEWTPKYPIRSPKTSKANIRHRKVSTFSSRRVRDWSKSTATLFTTQSL